MLRNLTRMPADMSSDSRRQLLHAVTDLFLLDLPADDAITRIEYRLNTTREARGDHETLEQLRVHREKFLALRGFFPQLVILDANETPAALHERIWQALTR